MTRPAPPLLLSLLLLLSFLAAAPHAHAQSVGAWATTVLTSSLPPRTRSTLALSSTAVVLSGATYPAGSVVFYGGQNRDSYNSTLGASNDNDVWISSDAGDTWRHVAGHYRNLSAPAGAWITAPTPFADTSFVFYDGAASCSEPTLGVYYRIGGRVRNTTAPTPQWITTSAVYMSSTNALSWSARPAASLPPRAFANCVVLSNGTVLVYNGFMTYAPGTDDGTATVADAWASYDSGATFVMINRNATYRARGDAMLALQKPPHPSVDPQPLIWLLGGRAATGNLAWLNDVYVSSNYGATWTLRTSTASWYATSGGTALVSDRGLLTLVGGLDQYQKFQDIWVSADGGLADWSVFSLTTPNVIGPGAAIILPQSMGRVLWVGGENYTHDLNGIVRFNYGMDVDPALLLSVGSSTMPEAACVGYQRCTRSPQMRINNSAETDSIRGLNTLRFRLPVARTYASSYMPTGNLSAASGSMIIISGGLRRHTMSAYWTGDEGLTTTPIDTESVWVEEPIPCVAGSGTSSVLVLTGGVNEENVHVNLVQASYDFGSVWSTVSGNIMGSAGNSSFTPRRGHACFGVGSGMSLVVFGGFQGEFEETNEQTSNDVWTSDDGGRTWQQRSAAPWLPRAQMAAVQLRRDVASTQVRPADLMYVIGGQRKWLNATRSVVAFLNDVWASTDGLAWVQMSAAAPFRAREGGAVAVHSTGALVYAYGKGSAVGGSISATLWMRDMWLSMDGGASWVLIEDTQVLRNQAISMYAVSFFASNGRLVIMSGTYSNVFLESQTLFTTPSSLAALNADVPTSVSVGADACFAPQYVCTGDGTLPGGGSTASSAVRKAMAESFASVVMSVSMAVVAIAWMSALLV